MVAYDKPAVQKWKIEENRKSVAITWDNGNLSRFHSNWLRINCRCPKCLEPDTNLLILPVHEIPLELTIRDVSMADDGSLNIYWNEEDHQGVSPINFLKEECYSQENYRRKRDSEKIKFYEDTEIKTISWNDVKTSEKGMYRWLRILNDRGLCLMTDVPAERDYMKKVVEKIGPITVTASYGEIWNNLSTDTVADTLYTPNPLPFHQDLNSMEGQIGLVNLHCLRFDESILGGETVFVDVIHIAEIFREEYPEEFKMLTKVPNTYRLSHFDENQEFFFVHRKPIIELNDEDEIMRVSWSIYTNAQPLVNEENVEEYCRAFQLFAKGVANYPYQKQHRLRPTELITCNNRRMAHSRKHYTLSSSGIRHLQACYVTLDDFKSRLRILSERFGDDTPIKAVYNSDWT